MIHKFPHERIFNFPRKSTTGSSVPTWLAQPGPVLLKRHVRNKSDPLVDEVELLHSNPHYAFVCFRNDRETSVATKHLAPSGGGENLIPESEDDIDALPDDIAEASPQRCDVALLKNKRLLNSKLNLLQPLLFRGALSESGDQLIGSAALLLGQGEWDDFFL